MQLSDFTTESLAAAIEEQNLWMAEEERRELELDAQRAADQHEEILAGLAGERAHSRIAQANGNPVRWTYNADGSMANGYCSSCDNSPCICEIDSSEQDTHRTDPTLYRVDGDLYTTKRPTCGECGFTVRKDGTCGFCE